MDGSGGRHRQKTLAPERRRPAFALVALLAVFLQTFVVQTHIHGPAAFFGNYEQRADAHAAHQVEAVDEHQASCALCQALAAAGSATLPSEASVVAAGRASQAAIVSLALAPRVHTHSWQSRAPPSFL
jgi:hypothetical protein